MQRFAMKRLRLLCFMLASIILGYADCTFAETTESPSFPFGSAYIQGFPQRIEFYRALWGSGPPCQPTILHWPADPFGCTTNEGVVNANNYTVLVAKRGGCSFFEKSIVASRSGMSGLLVINDRPGLLRMPSGKAPNDREETAQMFIAMIKNSTAELFVDQQPNSVSFFADREGCVAPSDPAESHSREPPRLTSAVDVSTASGQSVEAALAKFGSLLGFAAGEVAVAFSYSTLCSAVELQHINVTERAVVAYRGECPMSAKAALAQAAGAKALLLLSSSKFVAKESPPQATEGAQPPMCGENCSALHIPTLLLSRSSTQLIADDLQAGGAVRVTATNGRMDLWADLIELKHGKLVKQMDAKQSTRLFFDLAVKHHPASITGSQERFEYVQGIASQFGQSEVLGGVVKLIEWAPVNQLLENHMRVEPPSNSDSRIELLSKIPFSTALLAGVPVVGLQPLAQDVLNCRMDGNTFIHKVLSYSHTSPFPLLGRTSSALRSLLCIQKYALNAALVLGEHIAHLRSQESPAEFRRAMAALEHLVPAGHSVEGDTFETHEELWLRVSQADEESPLIAALSLPREP